MICPTEDDLLAWVQGSLAADRAGALEAHVADCRGCGSVIAEAARELHGSRDGTADEPGRADLGGGERLGRYVVLDLVGRGAMGTVYAAYDPQLDRRVALKLLRPGHAASAAAAPLQGRLLREGQTMARLRHANVVAVYDVGVVDDGVFLAMEFVAGETLGRWLARAPRSWRAIRDAFVQAGRGLAAAHAAGIVHRDFKPDNVLVGEDGAIRVTDFGLARAEASAAAPTADLAATQAGALLGTPAFMAPEQLRGDAIGPAVDIFAFSSALYQALFGQRPYAGDDLAELRAAMARGEAREPPATHGVPAHVRRALRRGLRAVPEERPRSMDELLRALTADPARRLLLAAAPVVVVVALVAAWQLGRHDDARLCQAGHDRVAAVWGAPERQSVLAALAVTGAPYAARTGEVVTAALDAYAAAWTEAYTVACEATHRRGEQSAALLDRRMQCLDDRLRDVAATVETLAHVDRAGLDKAPAVAAGLRGLEACADRERLLAVVAPPEDAAGRARVDAARVALAQARAQRLAGRYSDGLPAAERGVAEGRATAYAPLEAEGLLELGLLQRAASRIPASEESFERAVQVATRAGDEQLQARAATEMASALGFDQKSDEMRRWAGLAEAHIAHLGDDPLLRAPLLLARGFALSRLGDTDDALHQVLEGEALLEGRLVTGQQVASALNRVGAAYFRASHYPEALLWGQRALAEFERVLGPDHPETANAMANVSAFLKAVGRRREALALAEKALAIREAALGAEHREVGLSHQTVGQIQLELGRYREAAASLERAEAIVEKNLGPNHAEDITSLALLALALPPAGRAAEGVAAGRRALAIAVASAGPKSAMAAFVETALAGALEGAERYEEAGAASRHAAAVLAEAIPGHSDLGGLLDGEGRWLARAGKLAEAQDRHQRAIAILEKSLGPTSSDLGLPLIDLGKVQLVRGDVAGARASLERAVAILDGAEVDPLVLAEGQLELGRALDAGHADAARAAALRTQAETVISASPYARAELRERAGATR